MRHIQHPQLDKGLSKMVHSLLIRVLNSKKHFEYQIRASFVQGSPHLQAKQHKNTTLREKKRRKKKEGKKKKEESCTIGSGSCDSSKTKRHICNLRNLTLLFSVRRETFWSLLYFFFFSFFYSYTSYKRKHQKKKGTYTRYLVVHRRQGGQTVLK